MLTTGTWLTLPEAAARYGVTRTRLKTASRRGKLVTHKLGTHKRAPLLVQPDEVERYLRETRHGRPAKESPKPLDIGAT